MKGKRECCILLLFCLMASASSIIISSMASDDGLVKSQWASDRASFVLNSSQEKAKSVADRVSLLKYQAELRNSNKSKLLFNASEEGVGKAGMRSYPTGLIVTRAELAENRAKIRDANRLMAASGINVSYPLSWDWRSRGAVTPVKDQSGCGACVAFATLAAEESAWLIGNSSQKYDLSEWYLFQKGKGYCGTGSQFERILSAAASGTVSEECCPYLKSTLCTSPLYKITSWKKIYTAAEAKEHLSKKGPLMTGMEVYEDFFWVDSNEIYSLSWGGFMGYHAVCIVGYDDTAKCWIVKNSWSRTWGDQGYARIAYDQCGMGSEFPFYAVEVAAKPDPVPASKTFSARVISRPLATYDFGITSPEDKWVLKATKYGATGQIGIYPGSQRFGYRLRTAGGVTYYSDPKKNPDGLSHASILEISGGKIWITWRGIASKYSSDLMVEVSSK